MSTILLTYGTRPIAQRIIKLLNTKHQLILATNEEIPSVLSHAYKSIPNPANPVFAHEMLKICLDQSIDLVLPLGESEIAVLGPSTILFEEYGISILLPSMNPQLEIAKQVPSETPLQVVQNGKSLLDESQSPDAIENGVYAVVGNNWLPVII
ncbi:hypothetical protein [Sphingobacterium chungjuense]|uniref:hypothetical protein n=1 Tax=Sphingobacterium chungjuense TaxID=2675553 RepID=UPI00140911FC|nr:hypothetical protein [Sphingobacterium chungjuense]